MSKVTTETLGTGRLLLMSSAVSATAANLYYNQPILPKIGTELGLTSAQLGAVPAASQIRGHFAAQTPHCDPIGNVSVVIIYCVFCI